MSGLGLLEDFFIGGTREAEEDGVMVLDEEDEARFEDDPANEGRLPTTARSELFFVIIAGRCGSGGPGRDNSG